MKTYAKVAWCVDDILSERPEWTRCQAREFIQEIESNLSEQMIQAGWDVIRATLSEVK